MLLLRICPLSRHLYPLRLVKLLKEHILVFWVYFSLSLCRFPCFPATSLHFLPLKLVDQFPLHHDLYDTSSSDLALLISHQSALNAGASASEALLCRFERCNRSSIDFFMTFDFFLRRCQHSIPLKNRHLYDRFSSKQILLFFFLQIKRVTTNGTDNPF